MNEELEEQASLYVLGLLEGPEAAAFEQRLQTDPALRAFADELDEAAAALAHGAPSRPLPPDLRGRILAEIAKSKAVAWPLRSTWLPWAIAACLALASAYLIAERAGLRARVTFLEQRDFLAQIQLASLTSQLRNAPEATAVIAWDERKQRGLLKVTHLPPNDADRDYQLWLVDPRYQNPVDGGVFHVSRDDGTLRLAFQPRAPVRGAKGFAISLERKGGVPKAEGPVVLFGK